MKKSKPSSKPAAPQVKPAAAKKKTAAVSIAPAPAAPAKPKKAVTKKTAAPKKIATPAKPKPSPASTTIKARIDIGFGNTLYLRGEGAGLSWDSGVSMSPVAADAWTYTLAGATGPVTFKLLVNDLSWSAGEDFVVAAGQTIEVAPTF